MVLLFQISSLRYIQCYTYHAYGLYLFFIPLYLPAIGKTCMYGDSEKPCRVSFISSYLGPDRSSQRIPQVPWTGIKETCYFQTKKPHCWPWFLIDNPMTQVNCRIRLFTLPRIVAELFWKHWIHFVLSSCGNREQINGTRFVSVRQKEIRKKYLKLVDKLGLRHKCISSWIILFLLPLVCCYNQFLI